MEFRKFTFVQMAGMKDGYFDNVFDVLDARCHPCIMIGHFALPWMGAAATQDHASAQYRAPSPVL
jgi:hypothetical protein